jgi:hypothetical protein
MLIWQDLPARYVQESPQMIATSTNLFIMPHLPSLAFEQVILFVRYNASTEELFFPVKSLTPLLDNDEVWGVTFSDGDRVVQSRAGSNLHVLEHPPPDYFNKLETLALETLPSAAVPCEDLTRWLAPKMAAEYRGHHYELVLMAQFVNGSKPLLSHPLMVCDSCSHTC